MVIKCTQYSVLGKSKIIDSNGRTSLFQRTWWQYTIAIRGPHPRRG